MCGTIVGTIVFLVGYSVIFYVYRNEAKCLDKLWYLAVRKCVIKELVVKTYILLLFSTVAVKVRRPPVFRVSTEGC